MKNNIKIFTFISMLFCCANSTVSADTLNIAVGDFCPYQCDPKKENGKIGFMSEITKIIFEQAGHEVNFIELPFKRAISETEQGLYDFVVCNEGHSTKLIFSKERISVLEQTFFVHKDTTWRYEGIKSLEAIIIASVIGYDLSAFNPEYEAYLQRNRHTNSVQYIGGDNFILRNAKKIQAGRVTTYNEDSDLFNYSTMRAGINDEFISAGILGRNSLYVGFSPENAKSSIYADIFDKGIVVLRKSGKLKSILASYGVEDWE